VHAEPAAIHDRRAQSSQQHHRHKSDDESRSLFIGEALVKAIHDRHYRDKLRFRGVMSKVSR